VGSAVDRIEFDDGAYAEFGARLEACLQAFEELLARPGFGLGAATLGAELELFLIDGAARPLPRNRAVLGATDDERLTTELDRFNLECNLRPCPLGGAPFRALGAELESGLAAARSAAAVCGGRIVPIGILPTLRAEDLDSGAITNLPRYRALSNGIRRLKRAPFHIHIEGEDSLAATSNDVAFEGASTSFQIHLRTEPAQFAALYNAAQLATGPALAAAGNSPLFLGRRLWEETRIALFKQATDPRPETTADWRHPGRVSFGDGWVREGALELFRQSVALHPPLLPISGTEDPVAAVRAGAVPALAELRLHNGTVWSWNRAVYDPAGGGHLRVELRALPAGPSVPDMLANAAFLVGLTLDLAPEIVRLLPAFPFKYAERNFYRAAQRGLAAELLWPTERPPSPAPWRAADLVLALLPRARRGLLAAGVTADEVDPLLAVLEARVVSGQTGAVWQRRTLAALERGRPRDEALPALVERYHAAQLTGTAVHTWPVD
jgi:gamma-glutamyl:cysteine ligase YbdK (ATP-grasp superfamily)